MQENEQVVNTLVEETVSPQGETVESAISESSKPAIETSEPEQQKPQDGELPEYAKRKIGEQKSRYEKKIAKLEQTVQALTQAFPQTQVQQPQVQNNPFAQLNIEKGSVQETVVKTLAALASAKKQEEEAQELAQKQEELMQEAAKYDDFEDVVYNPSAPFTQSVVQAIHEIPNSTDVMYHLGLEFQEKKRTSTLHSLARMSPQQLRRKMVELSVEFMNKAQKTETKIAQVPKPVPALKTNPTAKTSTSRITSKSSVSEIRQRLKQR